MAGGDRLSRLSGEFRDPSREHQFQCAVWPRTRGLIRVTVAATALLVLVGLGIDLVTFAVDDDQLWLLLACRAVALCFAAIPLSLSARTEYQSSHGAATIAYLWVLFAMVLAVAEVRGGRGGLLIFFLAVLCVAVAQYFLVRASFLLSLSSGLLMTVGALTYVGTKDEFASTEYLVLTTLVLVGNGLAGYLVAEINRTLREGHLWVDNEQAGIARLRAEVARRATAEAAAREARDQLAEALGISRAVQDATPVAMVAVDGRGRVIAWNAAFLRLWGVTTADLSGLSALRLREVLTAGLTPLSRDALLVVAETGETAPDLMLADGRAVAQWVRDFSAGSVGKGKAWFFLDVTSRRETADALRQDARTLEVSSRARTAVLESIGHDLASIVDRLRALDRQLASRGDGLEMFARGDGAELAIRALQSTLSTLLQELRSETVADTRPQPFDLITALQDIAALHSDGAGSLIVTLSDDFPSQVHGDEARVRRIVSGLIDRVRALGGDAPVRIAATVLEKTDDRLWLALDVTRGDPPGDVARKRWPNDADGPADAPLTRPKSTDLGFLVGQELATLLGGRLEALNPDGASDVRLSLPFLAMPADAPVPAKDAATPTRPLSVLIAEDDEINQRLLVAVLEGRGHKVTAVADGAQAVAAARLGGYDAALLDVRMPSLDGMEAARLIRAFPGPERTLPLLGVTANISPQSRDACLAAGMDGVLVKPYSAEGLLAELDRLTAATDRGDVGTSGPNQ